MRMNKKTMLLIIPAIALLACCIAAICVICIPSSYEVYTKQIQTAEKYLADKDYDGAIKYYEMAKATDETQEEPYLKLAMIYYENKNDMEKVNINSAVRIYIVYLMSVITDIQVHADSTIVSVSQGPKDKLVNTTEGLKASANGLLVTNQFGETTHPGIFAAGDVVLGAKTVVEATAYAKVVADAMDQYMQGTLEEKLPE